MNVTSSTASNSQDGQNILFSQPFDAEGLKIPFFLPWQINKTAILALEYAVQSKTGTK